jgi:hypothetical protein
MKLVNVGAFEFLREYFELGERVGIERERDRTKESK